VEGEDDGKGERGQEVRPDVEGLIGEHPYGADAVKEGQVMVLLLVLLQVLPSPLGLPVAMLDVKCPTVLPHKAIRLVTVNHQHLLK